MSTRIGYRSLTRRERREVRQSAKQGRRHADAWVAAVCWCWASELVASSVSKGNVVGEVIGGILAPGSSAIGRDLLDRRLARRLVDIGPPPKLLPEDEPEDDE